MTFLLDLNENQRLILDTLDRATREANDFDQRRRRLRAAPPARMALWEPLAELGALGLCLTEDQGGFGGTPRDMALLPAAIGGALVVEPFQTVGITAARLLAAAGDAELLGDLVAGNAVPVPALFESADVFAAPTTEARGSGDGLRLTGRKPAVRHGDVATAFLVSASGDDGTTVLALMAADAPGLTRTPFRLIDDAGAADLEFSGTPARAVLRGPAAEAALAEALDWTLAALTVEVAAICTAINPATFGYLKERKQFGQPLARFQGLQFKAADMHIARTEAEAAAELAIRALELPAGQRRKKLLSASLAADRTGKVCAHHAVQLHGGMGVSDELVISHYARRLAAIRAQIGTTDLRAAALEALSDRSAA